MRFTDEQARALAALVGTADGGCGHCARDLAYRLAELDPSRDWQSLRDANDLWETPWGKAELTEAERDRMGEPA